MLAVISPAKTFGPGQCAVDECTQPSFLPDTDRLIDQLKTMKSTDISKLMSVSAKIAQLNVGRYKAWKKKPSIANAKQALVVFRGDVYRSLDSDSFSKSDFDFAQKHLRILSGLYGVLRPLDLIQEYRLEMGTRLKTDRGDNLYQFWGDKVTRLINKELASHKKPVLVNLASTEYFKVLDPDKIDAEIITPVFKEKRGDTYKVIGISAKRARGAMVNHIIKNRIKRIDDIKQFNQDGYSYRPGLSDDHQWVFARS